MRKDLGAQSTYTNKAPVTRCMACMGPYRVLTWSCARKERGSDPSFVGHIRWRPGACGLPFILCTCPSLLKLPFSSRCIGLRILGSRVPTKHVSIMCGRLHGQRQSAADLAGSFRDSSRRAARRHLLKFFSWLRSCSLCCVQAGLNPKPQIRKDSISEILHVRPHHQRLILSDARSAKRLFDSQRVLQLSSKDPFGTLELLLVLDAELRAQDEGRDSLHQDQRDVHGARNSRSFQAFEVEMPAVGLSEG